VTVTIGGVVRGSYLLQPSEQKRVDYDLNDGPVVVSSSGQDIIRYHRGFPGCLAGEIECAGGELADPDRDDQQLCADDGLAHAPGTTNPGHLHVPILQQQDPVCPVEVRRTVNPSQAYEKQGYDKLYPCFLLTSI